MNLSSAFSPMGWVRRPRSRSRTAVLHGHSPESGRIPRAKSVALGAPIVLVAAMLLTTPSSLGASPAKWTTRAPYHGSWAANSTGPLIPTTGCAYSRVPVAPSWNASVGQLRFALSSHAQICSRYQGSISTSESWPLLYVGLVVPVTIARNGPGGITAHFVVDSKLVQILNHTNCTAAPSVVNYSCSEGSAIYGDSLGDLIDLTSGSIFGSWPDCYAGSCDSGKLWFGATASWSATHSITGWSNQTLSSSTGWPWGDLSFFANGTFNSSHSYELAFAFDFSADSSASVHHASLSGFVQDDLRLGPGRLRISLSSIVER